MAKAIKKATAADLERNITASVEEAARLKLKIEGLQEKLRATEDGIHSLEANLKDVEEIATKVHVAIRKPLRGTSAKRAVPVVRRPQ